MIRDILFSHGGLFMRYAIFLILAMAAGAWGGRFDGPDKRAATLIVAASNAPDYVKQGADYVCSGTSTNTVDDAAVINAALLRVYNESGGYNGIGGVVKLVGEFWTNTSVVMQTRVSLLAEDNLQGTKILMRAAGSGPIIYYNANGRGRNGQFEISNITFGQKSTTPEWAVKLDATKSWTVTATATLAANPPIEGSNITSSGGGTGIVLLYTATTTVKIGPDVGSTFAGGETVTYTGTNGPGTFVINTATEATSLDSYKDCIFQNIYITISSGGGWYQAADWSGHYENCTFEYCQGNGFEGNKMEFTEFNGCYFAHNTEHGFAISGTNATAGGVVLTSCWSSDNGDVQLGHNPNPDGIEPFAGFYVDINGDPYTPMAFVGCYATMNSGWGFYANNGWYITYTNCYAGNNNWQGPSNARTRQGGFYSAAAALYPMYTNCTAQKNDVAWINDKWVTGGGTKNGVGFILRSSSARMSNCFTAKQCYGVQVDADDCVVDARHARGIWANTGANIVNSKNSVGTVFGSLKTDVFNDPGVADADGIYTHAINNHTTTTAMSQPKYSRAVTIAGTDETAAGTVSIIGYDSFGSLVSIDVRTVSGTTPITTTRAYSKITSIAFSAGTGSANVGWADVLGLSSKIEAAGDVLKVIKNGAILAAAEYTVNVNAAGVPYGTVTLTTPIQASDVFEIIYAGK